MVSVGIGLKSLNKPRNRRLGREELFIIGNNNTANVIDDIVNFQALDSVEKLNDIMDDLCPLLCS